MLRALLTAAALCLGAAGALAAGDPNEIPVPKLTAHVVDLTGTLTADERGSLDAKLVQFERERGSQVAVLLVPSIGTEAIEDFATRVTDQWQLGRKGVDDGVLLVIAKEQRKLRIQTGRGVQGTLTDFLSKRIVSDIIAPRFRNGDFAGGIDDGVDAIIKAVQGEQLPLPEVQRSSAHRVGSVGGIGSLSNFLILGFFLVPVVGMVLRGLVGRFFGAGLTSGITGFAAWVVLGSLGIGIVAAVIAFLITLFGGTGLARGIGPGIGGWGGGGFGGGFGGGGGGGGFSGGGGGFDGGGASGSW